MFARRLLLEKHRHQATRQFNHSRVTKMLRKYRVFTECGLILSEQMDGSMDAARWSSATRFQ
jgi:hypothetical protein